jgi:hypothetical protein
MPYRYFLDVVIYRYVIERFIYEYLYMIYRRRDIMKFEMENGDIMVLDDDVVEVMYGC